MSGLRPITADLVDGQPIPHHRASRPPRASKEPRPYTRQPSRLFRKEYMVTADLRTPDGYVYTGVPIVPNNRVRDIGRPLTRFQARKLVRRVHLTIPEAAVMVGQGARP